jgi:hypothetical protein
VVADRLAAAGSTAIRGLPATLGVLMIIVGLIPPVHVFVQFVRAVARQCPAR